MTNKSLLFLGTLALAAVAFAGPKSYDILLTAPTQAGANQLAAGEYRVQVQGSNAIFTNVENKHSFVAPVKVATTTQKHEVTAVETKADAGSARLTSIDLGGSTETLQFGE
ncbi:MAG TPA: hypothetical protein VME43_31100 [Bryobacteraceae bacterium]|nr:hypothetical protein [Bryobacteraceae bacterium]